MHNLEGQLKRAFVEFAQLLNSEPLFARENELVSLFVFGPLLRQVAPKAALHDARQVGIEVAVRQYLARAGGKAMVRKDLVIWPRAGQTAWSSKGEVSDAPLTIVEWKGGRAKSRTGALRREHAHDLAFLRAFTKATPSDGYAAFVSHQKDRWLVTVARVANGAVQLDWFDTGDA